MRIISFPLECNLPTSRVPVKPIFEGPLQGKLLANSTVGYHITPYYISGISRLGMVGGGRSNKKYAAETRCGPQSLSCLLSGPLQKMFANSSYIYLCTFLISPHKLLTPKSISESYLCFISTKHMIVAQQTWRGWMLVGWASFVFNQCSEVQKKWSAFLLSYLCSCHVHEIRTIVSHLSRWWESRSLH